VRKLLFVVLVFAITLWAANFKLYLKDGGYQLVREYWIDGDRVKYYSVDRSDWEEIPADLVDLKRTDAEAGARRSAIENLQKQDEEEKAAAREIRQETLKIPRDPGTYRLENEQLRVFKAAEGSVHDAKGRNILRALSPIPMIPGKATLEIPGEHSAEVVNDKEPEFFLQLSQFESFGMVKLKPGKGVRVVERMTIDAITKETAEERDKVEIFTKQLSENGLYKIWPQDALAKGEYAIVEYAEGKVNMQVWDFRIE
jgi:hypothetical protein